MPRSSRGSSGHRGHRNRKRHGEQGRSAAVAQRMDAAAARESAAPEVVAVPADDDAAPAPMPAPPPRRAPAPQPPGTTVSGASLQGDPLLTKELIRIGVFAVFIAVLLVVLTTVLGE